MRKLIPQEFSERALHVAVALTNDKIGRALAEPLLLAAISIRP